MRLAALLFLFPFALAHAQENVTAPASASDLINVEEELGRLGSSDGVWVGLIRPTIDTVGAYRQWPDGFPIRIEITGDDVRLWTIERGGVLEPFPGEAWLAVKGDGTTLIDYALGTDTLTEVWSISLNQFEPTRMKGFVSRTVHNFNLRKSSPWRLFAVYSIVDFVREPTDFLKKP